MWWYTNSFVSKGEDEIDPVGHEAPAWPRSLLRWLARRSPAVDRYLRQRAQRRALLEREIRQHLLEWQDMYIRLVQFNVLFGKEVIAPISDEEHERAAQAVADMRRLGRALGGGLGRMVRDLGLAIGSQLLQSESHMKRGLWRPQS